MKCPYCQQQMEYGIVRSNRLMWWAVEKDRLYFSPKYEDEFKIGHGIFGTKTNGYCCSDCKKIIIDYGY